MSNIHEGLGNKIFRTTAWYRQVMNKSVQIDKYSAWNTTKCTKYIAIFTLRRPKVNFHLVTFIYLPYIYFLTWRRKMYKVHRNIHSEKTKGKLSFSNIHLSSIHLFFNLKKSCQHTNLLVIFMFPQPHDQCSFLVSTHALWVQLLCGEPLFRGEHALYGKYNTSPLREKKYHFS